jgi:Na+/H+ antiporter NhaC
MAKHEANAKKGDLFTTGDRPYADAKQDVIRGKGKVIDLVFPILVLIISCIIGMIYTGGFFDGTGFVDAFAGSDASIGLMLGSFFALIITICFYSIRRVLSFTDCCNSIPEGFKAMVPAILILTFAWTLKVMTESLGAKEIRRRLGGRCIRDRSLDCSRQSYSWWEPSLLLQQEPHGAPSVYSYR